MSTTIRAGCSVAIAPEQVIHERIRRDPVWFCREILGWEPWSKQREILEAVRDHERVAVRSCHGVGKTAVAARIILWFMISHPGSCRVVTTAPSWKQIEKVLWAEIHSAAHHSLMPIGGELLLTEWKIAPDWYAIGLPNEPHKATAFQGHHARHLLLVVDEASGVDERIYDAAEGFLTASNAKVLLISNPTSLAGQFRRAFTDQAQLWEKIHVSFYDTPNVTGEVVPEQVHLNLPAADWGDKMLQVFKSREDPRYQVRVLGEFPSTADDTVVGYGQIIEAQQRASDPRMASVPRVVSCDVARFGSDETVIALREGNRVRIMESYQGRDLVHTASRIKVWRASPLDRIVVDDAGVGGGVTDLLRAEGIQVDAFNGGQAALTLDPVTGQPAYPNRRSEAWFHFAGLLPELDLDDDDQLLGDLSAPRYKYDSKLRRVVESKEETRKRLGRSPDRADAVLMAFAPSLEAGEAHPPPRRRLDLSRVKGA